MEGGDLFRKLGAHLFAFGEVDGKLDSTGKASPFLIVDLSIMFWSANVLELLFVAAPEPMIELRAAANADWKLGSDVIAAMVFGGRG